jgi:hypothetical protein
MPVSFNILYFNGLHIFQRFLYFNSRLFQCSYIFYMRGSVFVWLWIRTQQKVSNTFRFRFGYGFRSPTLMRGGSLLRDTTLFGFGFNPAKVSDSFGFGFRYGFWSATLMRGGSSLRDTTLFGFGFGSSKKFRIQIWILSQKIRFPLYSTHLPSNNCTRVYWKIPLKYKIIEICMHWDEDGCSISHRNIERCRACSCTIRSSFKLCIFLMHSIVREKKK